MPGLDVTVLDAGCCGMAGSFGYEKEHYDLSVQIANLALVPALNADPTATVVATGTSCRHQIRDLTGREALHPLEVAGGGHARIPSLSGSSASTISVASAVTYAVPVMLGITTPGPPVGSTRPSKTLPMMLSCRHTSPGFSLPSATRQASFALVPVPHGERS